MLADPDADGDGVPNAADAISYATKLVGQPSDPLMGKYNNLLGRAGFRVCVDVVAEAWMAAGVSLPRLLLDAAREHPEWFSVTDDNHPRDPNFVRRVRNYRDLFEHHPSLELGATAHPGDLAFYGRYHVAMVTEGSGGGYEVVEAYEPLIATQAGADVERRMGAPAGFGRVRASGPGR